VSGTDIRPAADATPVVPDPGRRAGELSPRELLSWTWRQLTSMRTALVLLLLLALAAVPGSVIPQEGVDSLKTSRWQEAHPRLTPVYDRLGLFDVYGSPWFSAVYILLMVSLVGCIVPRLFVYARAVRAVPPPAPRNLTRLPDSTSYRTEASVSEVHARAREVLGRRRYRLRAADGPAEAVSGERGHSREAGNLLFHLSVLIVLVGFGMGGLLGYKGGVIIVEGGGFSNTPTQYDEFSPGSLFRAEDMEPFSFSVDKFSAEWLTEGPRKGMARQFQADLSYRESPTAEKKTYDLQVNHPLTIGGTELFLIGHGYAPVITIRDGNGDVAYSGPTIFLPTDQRTFTSFGVVKAPDAQPTQIGLEGEFYPTYAFTKKTGPFSVFGNAINPAVSMLVYTGDLGMDDGASQSVYALDKSRTTPLKKADGSLFRLDLQPGQTKQLPNHLGSVSFDGVQPWTKIQISQTPGQRIALAGVVLALLGLLGSLFIRSRRVWVRARRDGDGTLVEVAALDRSGGGDLDARLREILADLRRDEPAAPDHRQDVPQDKEKP
jgi:cytochrome c biogenesis protein